MPTRTRADGADAQDDSGGGRGIECGWFGAMREGPVGRFIARVLERWRRIDDRARVSSGKMANKAEYTLALSG